MQHIYDDMKFRAPFFLSYLTNSLLVIYLPLWQMWICCTALNKRFNCTSCFSSSLSEQEEIVHELHKDVFSDRVSTDDSYHSLHSEGEDTPTSRTTVSHMSLSNGITPQKSQLTSISYTHYDVFKVALVIAPLYIMSNGLYNYSLSMTSISSSTIIRYLSPYFYSFGRHCFYPEI
jgi:hypothetical protein